MRPHNERHDMRVALVLGFIALAMWASFAPLRADFKLPLWHIPLFMVPIAFGLRGAYLVIPVAVFPIAILTDDWQSLIRDSILLIAIGVGRGVMPWLPGYVAVACAWAGIVLPLPEIMGPNVRMGQGWIEEQILFSYISEVLLALVAGALLLNPGVYAYITKRARPLNLIDLSSHVLALTVLLTIFGMLATLNRIGLFNAHHISPMNFWPAVGLVTTFIALPTLIAVRLAFVIFREFSFLSALSPQLASHAPSTDLLYDSEEFEVPQDINESDTKQKHRDGLTGVCAVDSDGAVLYMNDTFRALADIVMPGIQGRNIETLAAESKLVQFIADLMKSVDPGREVVTELKMDCRRGGPRFFEVALSPRENAEELDTPNGKVPRVVQLRDITERRTIERHLLAEQRMNSLGASLSGAAATFSDSFTAILARASHAIFSGSRDTANEALESISETAANGGRLARQLLEVADIRPLSGAIKVDARDAVAENVAMLQDLVGDNFEVVLETSLNPLPVEIEPALFSQSILNLVLNAREAYPSGRGTIALSVSEEEIDQTVTYMHPGTRPGRYARLRVEDKGIGMQADCLGRAADPLFTTKRAQGHTGLGLSTVFAIMREHGGFMCLESKPERGTTVSLYFPISMLPADTKLGAITTNDSTGASAASTEYSLTGDNRSVLVVEQQDDLRTLLSDMLESLGYRTSACKDESEAISLVEKQPVDFVLVDDALVNGPNCPLLSAVRNHPNGVVTVVMTNSTRGASAGESSLVKPFDITQLARSLKAASLQAQGTGTSLSNVIRLETPISE